MKACPRYFQSVNILFLQRSAHLSLSLPISTLSADSFHHNFTCQAETNKRHQLRCFPSTKDADYICPLAPFDSKAAEGLLALQGNIHLKMVPHTKRFIEAFERNYRTCNKPPCFSTKTTERPILAPFEPTVTQARRQWSLSTSNSNMRPSLSHRPRILPQLR